MSIAAWFILAIVVGMMARLMWQLHYTLESQGWPQVEGRVRNAEVVERSDSESRSWEPRIDYEYVVGRTLHSAHRLTYGLSGWGTKKSARRIVEAYQPGMPVTVWYDPSQPSRATLRPGGHRGVLVMLVLVSVIGLPLFFANTTVGRSFLNEHGIHTSGGDSEP